MVSFCVNTLKDLYDVRQKQDLTYISLKTGNIKRANALRYALKFCYWALAPGGELHIEDDGPNTFGLRPGQVPFSFVRQQTFKLLGADCELLHLDESKRRISLKRRTSITPSGWSAGIIFSGNSSEITSIHLALDGLLSQTELSPEENGEIIVCGPANAASIIDGYKNVSYLAHENEDGPRAFTTRKKNALLNKVRNSRAVILHTRMILAPDCLSAIPREFDAITPRVEYHKNGLNIPYLDWSVLPVLEGDRTPHSWPLRFDYKRDRYLSYLSTPGQPMIDGGLFMVTTTLGQSCDLNPNLAWGEAEDTEWCSRLHAAGALVELAPNALAVSQSCKFPRRYIEYPKFTRHTLGLLRYLRNWGP